MVTCLDKIKKVVPKKLKELKDMCEEAIDEINKMDPTTGHYSANAYFRILKIAFDTKIPKLTADVLYLVQKVVSHGYLDGNVPDHCLHVEEEPPKSNGILPRKLIDAIVDEVCKCAKTYERDM